MARVLVVEDNDEIRRAFVYALMRGGFEVDQAAGAGEGIAKVTAEPPPVVALVDLRLDEDSEGGFAVAMAADRRRTWLVAVSGASLAVDDAVSAAAFDEVLEKPVLLDVIVSTVRRLAMKAHV